LLGLFASSAGVAVAVEAPSVRIGMTPGIATSEAYIAEQLGYFKRAKVDVVLTQYSRTPYVLDAVLTGSLDLGLTTPQTIANAIIHGLPIRAVGTGMVFAEPAQMRCCVLKDAPINGPLDLRGGVVGVSVLNDIQSLAVFAWLDKNGVDFKSVRVIEMPFSTMADSLKRGTIQAATIAEPFMSASADELRPLPGVFETLGDHFAFQAFYTRSDFAKSHRDIVGVTMQQVYAAGKLATSQPDAVEALFATWSKSTPELVRTLPKPFFATAMQEDQYRTQLDLAFRYKMLPRVVTYRELTTN
jgi:NitT/TauT family transport system substrate-binding protein